jgi:hypothetical protein
MRETVGAALTREWPARSQRGETQRRPLPHRSHAGLKR